MGNDRSPENNHSTCKNVVLQNQVFSHEPSSLFHHSVLVDLNVSMMMH